MYWVLVSHEIPFDLKTAWGLEHIDQNAKPPVVLAWRQLPSIDGLFPDWHIPNQTHDLQDWVVTALLDGGNVLKQCHRWATQLQRSQDM